MWCSAFGCLPDQYAVLPQALTIHNVAFHFGFRGIECGKITHPVAVLKCLERMLFVGNDTSGCVGVGER